MTEGPFKAAFEADTKDVIRREIVTYRMTEKNVIREVAVREYYKDDYQDSSITTPLMMK